MVAVPAAKLGSWFLLIISYALVAVVNRPKPIGEALVRRGQSQPAST